MVDFAVRAEGLGKLYRISTAPRHTPALRDILGAPIASLRERMAARSRDFWALKDLSFTVKPGEAVAFLGHNGSGKSTTLKILSRIVTPTTGWIEIAGRLGCLLEVGTGFHPDLTGRENVFLNGAILGMGRREVKRKLDEIVAFAECEAFLEVPVKRYSSGMYTRLAFSVAAHLDPDVLVIDEVLAVGDAAFQKKCLGKMNDVSRQGRTVLFVSHNMAAVEALCGRGILLDRGRVLFDGPVREAVGAHMARLGGDAFSPDRLDERVAALPQDCEAVIRSVALRQDGRSVGTISNGCELEVLIEVEVKRPLDGFRIVLDLCDAQGNLIARSSHDEKTDSAPDVIRPGHYQARFTLPEAFLGPATYGFAVALATARGWLHGQRVEAAVPVVNDCAINRTRPRRRFEGKVLINGDWVLEVERQNQPRVAVR